MTANTEAYSEQLGSLAALKVAMEGRMTVSQAGLIVLLLLYLMCEETTTVESTVHFPTGQSFPDAHSSSAVGIFKKGIAL